MRSQILGMSVPFSWSLIFDMSLSWHILYNQHNHYITQWSNEWTSFWKKLYGMNIFSVTQLHKWRIILNASLPLLFWNIGHKPGTEMSHVRQHKWENSLLKLSLTLTLYMFHFPGPIVYALSFTNFTEWEKHNTVCSLGAESQCDLHIGPGMNDS